MASSLLRSSFLGVSGLEILIGVEPNEPKVGVIAKVGVSLCSIGATDPKDASNGFFSSVFFSSTFFSSV